MIAAICAGFAGAALFTVLRWWVINIFLPSFFRE